MSLLPARLTVLFLMLLLLPGFAAAALHAGDQNLEPAKELTGSFSADASAPREHIYNFAAAKGDYVEVKVDQQGCDVRLHIVLPDGRTAALVDSYNGAYGPECWRGALTFAGNYQVRVSSASVRGKEAKYKIALAVKRPASDDDRKRAQAQEVYNYALQRRQGGTQRDLDEAFYLYEQAAALYRQVGDLLGEAQSLESVMALGEPTLTKRLRLDISLSALTLFRRLREPAGEAHALHNLGALYASLNKPQDAISYYGPAINAYRAIGDRRSEAIVLNSLALVYLGLKQPQEALRYLQQALNVCRTAGDKASEALLLKYIGEVYEDIGQPSQAARYYKEAEAIGNGN